MLENGFWHPDSWRNGWILSKLVQKYCWDMDKNSVDLDDLDLFLKIIQCLRMLINGLSALLNEWMDFDQTYTDTSLGWRKVLIRYWWPWPHFQGHKRALIVGKWLVCTLSLEGMNGFWPNLHSYIVGTWTKIDLILVTLTLFSRSHNVLECWEMASISWKNSWILTKLAQIHW